MIRSVLWVGSADGLAASGLPEAARYDVVWERQPERLRELPLEPFDAAVVMGEEEACAMLARRRPELPVVRWNAERAEPAILLDELERACTTPGRAERSDAGPSDGLVGDSRALRRVRWLIARAAGVVSNVLILGETGTGKELVARAIHARSERRRGRFVAVNCAAFPDTLLESELLGHARGAFSGAERERRGLIEEANGGTLFLDEVAETSPAFQAKLLRVLQERVVRPLGANRERDVDVRVVAATHRDLAAAVRRGAFREDLFYRLAVLDIPVPPLRSRTSDLPALIAHLLARHGGADARDRRIDPSLWPLLEAHEWPGNVRELENEIQHALALAEPDAVLCREHFSDRLGSSTFSGADAPRLAEPGESLRVTVARFEAAVIRRTLAANAGRRTATARRLGLTREGLYKKMQRLGIE